MCSRIQFLCIIAGALVALATGGITARADDLVERLGPVGPNDTLLATVGNKRVIAFFQRDNGRCDLSAVMFEKSDADTGMTTAARVRASLRPHEIVYVDSPDKRTLRLQCGSNAATLEVPETDGAVVSGIRQPGAANTLSR
jgi:hypothetical protein